MSDSISSESWWQSRINEIKSQGFNTKNIVNKLERNASRASSIIEEYEKDLSLAKNLKNKINDLPSRLEVERISLLKKLEFAEKSNEVQNEFDSLILRHLPWISTAKNNKILWDSMGRGEYLNLILKRLDALDSSMSAYISEILHLFETPEKFDEFNKKIDDIELRQSERIATLDNMASLLSEHGFEVQGFNDLNLEERFDTLEKLQHLDEKHMQLERRINRTIGRFDSGTAADYNQQRLLLTKTRSEVEFDSLIERIKNAENNFLNRLQNINNQFSKWVQEGFNLNVHIPILADELLHREAQMSNISQNIEEYKQIWARLQKQLSIWPEEDAVTLIEFGNLSEKYEINDLVIELEKRSSLVEEEVRSKITRWKNKGFELKEVEWLNETNPVLAQNEMRNISIIFEKIVEAKDQLNNLDLSFNNKNKRNEWLERISEKTPTEESVNELLQWISKIEMRNARHRKMLENEWLNLKNDLKIDTGNLTLLEFENLIKDNARSYSSHQYNSTKGLKERLMIEIDLWLEDLRNKKWNIEDLILMRNENPNKLMKSKNEINKNIHEYEKLIKRLKPLPWNRNTILAEEVLLKLKKPNLLVEIKGLIPQYMQLLATSPSQNEMIGFDFTPWNPNDNVISKIKPRDVPEAEVIIDGPISSIDEGRISSLEQNFVDSYKGVESKEYTNISSNNLKASNNQSNFKNYEEEKGFKKFKNKKILPQEENNEIVEMIKGIKTEKHQPTAEEWEIYTGALKNILSELGISKEFDLTHTTNLESLSNLRKGLAKFVGITPRDLRVDRLLRILLRVIPINLPENITLNELSIIIKDLAFCANKLNKWTSKRLERRHNNSSNKLLNDSKQLGEVLIRIPSPGFAIPLDSDSYELPSINNLEELRDEIKNLKKYIL